MSFLYPRTLSITRPVSALSSAGGLATAPASQPGGSIPYIGLRNTESGGETTIASGVPCSIQNLSARALSDKSGVPSSAAGPVRWKFFIPLNALAFGSVKNRDIITDDLGNRYQVSADYWDSLGYAVEAVREEE